VFSCNKWALSCNFERFSCKNSGFSCNSKILEQGTKGFTNSNGFWRQSKAPIRPLIIIVGREKFLNCPTRCRLAGILMGILVSEELVVILNNKMTSLNLICYTQPVL